MKFRQEMLLTFSSWGQSDSALDNPSSVILKHVISLILFSNPPALLTRVIRMSSVRALFRGRSTPNFLHTRTSFTRMRICLLTLSSVRRDFKSAYGKMERNPSGVPSECSVQRAASSSCLSCNIELEQDGRCEFSVNSCSNSAEELSQDRPDSFSVKAFSTVPMFTTLAISHDLSSLTTPHCQTESLIIGSVVTRIHENSSQKYHES